jgi:hypothetical protein
MADVIPPANLPPEAQPWGRQITKLAVDLETNVSRGLNDVNNNQIALQRNVDVLSTTIQDVQATQTYLNTLSTSQSVGSTSVTTFTGPAWATSNLPTTTVQTSTGNLMVFISSSLGKTTGAIGATFSIDDYVLREEQLSALVQGVLVGNRNGIEGTFPSAMTLSYAQLVTGLPVDTNLTVRFQIYNNSSANGTYVSPQLTTMVVA